MKTLLTALAPATFIAARLSSSPPPRAMLAATPVSRDKAIMVTTGAILWRTGTGPTAGRGYHDAASGRHASRGRPETSKSGAAGWRRAWRLRLGRARQAARGWPAYNRRDERNKCRCHERRRRRLWAIDRWAGRRESEA